MLDRMYDIVHCTMPRELPSRISMRSLLAFALMFFCGTSVHAFASCTRPPLSVFPHHRNICSRPMFVLEGFARSQQVVAGLNKIYPVYLEGGGERVALRVTDIVVGRHDLTQAVLVPTAELVVGCDYDLVIDGLPDSVRHEQSDSTEHTWITATYTVVEGRDTVSPTITARPVVVGTSNELAGGSPSTWVRFSNTAHDESEIIVKTTVKSMQTGNVTIYYVEPRGATISVGRGGCGAAFTFSEGNVYEVEFIFMDSAGNVTPWTGARIAFNAPLENAGIEK